MAAAGGAPPVLSLAHSPTASKNGTLSPIQSPRPPQTKPPPISLPCRVHVRVVEGKHLLAKDVNGFSDPYVKLSVINAAGVRIQKQRSKAVDKTLHPVWNEDFYFDFTQPDQALDVRVVDHDILRKDDPIGAFKVPFAEIPQAHHAHWYQVQTAGDAPAGRVALIFSVDKQESKASKALLDNQLQISVAANNARKTAEYVVSVWTGTWNVGNAPPPAPENLASWVQPGHDIYAFASQETSYKPGNGNYIEHWQSVCLNSIPKANEPYRLIRHHHLMEMHIVVFIRESLFPYVHNVAQFNEATGIASVVGNKGGVAVTFMLRDSSFCFLSSHLAAHQGQAFLERRNADYEEICRGSAHPNGIDILHQFHYFFWMGDLNYRVDYGDQADDKGKVGKKPPEAVFEEIVRMIEAGNHDALYATDQLQKEMREGRVFQAFKTAPPPFMPTFSMEREPGLKYNPKRTPSWADRILWRSIAPAGVFPEPELVAYQSCPDICTSDHKPVYAVFRVADASLPLAVTPRKKDGSRIKFLGLSGHNLKSMDLNGFSDPYIQFIAPYLSNAKKHLTKPQKKTLHPVWPEKDVPELVISFENKERLARDLLVLKVMDKDQAKDECMGYAILDFSIENRLSGEPVPFTIPVSLGGNPYGTLSGHVQVLGMH